MTQAVTQEQSQVPAVCPVCQTWGLMPYAARPTTPINAGEAFNIMCVGYWLVCRGATEQHLCAQHADILTRLDFQKHAREEWERTEKLRLEEEARKAQESKYPTPQHENIASVLLNKIAEVNIPRIPARVAVAHPAMLSADPNTFPCPDCGKPVRNGEVHGCASPAGQ